jgi:hypothetical protein
MALPIGIFLIFLAGWSSACGGGAQRLTGYWQGSPSKEFGRMLVLVEKTRGDRYRITGLWTYPIVSRALSGTTLVWHTTPGPAYDRVELSLEQGGAQLLVREFSSPSSSHPQFAFGLTRASGSGRQLQAEMRKLSAARTDPELRDEIDTLGEALMSWAEVHDHRYPSKSAMAPGGSFWKWHLAPALQNPVAGRLMRLASDPGDFGYTVTAGNLRFTLTGHSLSGASYTVSGP